mmetsp:Transcript_6913/g.15513  ORF Transcript_6913/g.15513 Transcript_6913/m.15513 type:complete len:231 (-) Transcript_6913:192-884(-)
MLAELPGIQGPRRRFLLRAPSQLPLRWRNGGFRLGGGLRRRLLLAAARGLRGRTSAGCNPGLLGLLRRSRLLRWSGHCCVLWHVVQRQLAGPIPTVRVCGSQYQVGAQGEVTAARSQEKHGLALHVPSVDVNDVARIGKHPRNAGRIALRHQSPERAVYVGRCLEGAFLVEPAGEILVGPTLSVEATIDVRSRRLTCGVPLHPPAVVPEALPRLSARRDRRKAADLPGNV